MTRTVYTFKEKVAILDKLKRMCPRTDEEAARALNVNRTTLARMVDDEDKIRESATKDPTKTRKKGAGRKAGTAEVEPAVKKDVVHAHKRGTPMSRDGIVAHCLAQSSPDYEIFRKKTRPQLTRWVTQFVNRHDLSEVLKESSPPASKRCKREPIESGAVLKNMPIDETKSRILQASASSSSEVDWIDEVSSGSAEDAGVTDTPVEAPHHPPALALAASNKRKRGKKGSLRYVSAFGGAQSPSDATSDSSSGSSDTAADESDENEGGLEDKPRLVSSGMEAEHEPVLTSLLCQWELDQYLLDSEYGQDRFPPDADLIDLDHDVIVNRLGDMHLSDHADVMRDIYDRGKQSDDKKLQPSLSGAKKIGGLGASQDSTTRKDECTAVLVLARFMERAAQHKDKSDLIQSPNSTIDDRESSAKRRGVLDFRAALAKPSSATSSFLKLQDVPAARPLNNNGDDVPLRHQATPTSQLSEMCSYLSTVALFVFDNKFVGLFTRHEAAVPDVVAVPKSRQQPRHLPRGNQLCVRAVLRPGDAIVSITKYFDHHGISAIELRTKVGESLTCGLTTENIVTESVPPNMVVCGFSFKTKRGTIKAIKDVSLRLRIAPSLDQLHLRLTRLRVSNDKSAIKNDALLNALSSAVDRVTAIHSRDVVSTTPLVAMLIAMCDNAQKQFHPGYHELLVPRRDRSLALMRIHEDLEVLLVVMLRFEETEAESMMDSQATNGDRTTLRTFVDQTITADNASRFVALHDLHPMPLLEYRTTDRLVAYLIESGNVPALEQVASKHASALGTTVPRAMASLAERVPAIRLAVARGQVSSLRRLTGVACLEPLDPPPAPSPLSICGLPPSRMALAMGMDAGPARDTILLLLNRVDRRRRFIANWAALAKRTDEPITLHELLALVDDITQVRELQPLQLLAASSLVLDEQRSIFLAAANHVTDHGLMLCDGAALCFSNQLVSARDSGLISTDEYEKLKWDAQKIDVVRRTSELFTRL